jgi:hypothetical protein
VGGLDQTSLPSPSRFQGVGACPASAGVDRLPLAAQSGSRARPKTPPCVAGRSDPSVGQVRPEDRAVREQGRTRNDQVDLAAYHWDLAGRPGAAVPSRLVP